MRVERFPRRDEALVRLCATEPALCGGGTVRKAPHRLLALALLLLALGLFLLPDRAHGLRVKGAAKAPAVTSVESVGMTVSDMDASVQFYTRGLALEKVSEGGVWGEECERLQGLFGGRMRPARRRRGDETIELRESLAPGGRPIPADSRSNDRWF